MIYRVVSIIGGSLLFTACSTAHPVLYHNAHMQSVGKEIAAQDIEACRQSAEAAGAEEGSGKAGRVATGTAVGGWGRMGGALCTRNARLGRPRSTRAVEHPPTRPQRIERRDA
jgi:hypothetical protein